MKSCPPIYGVDETSQITCVPPLQGNNSAPHGTYCIFSCHGHPVDELLCQDGHWSDDPNHLSCSSSSTAETELPSTTPRTTTSETDLPTTTHTPQIEVENTWGFYYLGTGIGASGIIVLEDGTFIVGSGSGFGGNTKLSLVKKSANKDGYFVSRELKLDTRISRIARLHSLNLIAVGTDDGRIVLVYEDLQGIYDIIDGGVQGEEIKEIITFHPDLRKRLDMVVLGENYLNMFKNITLLGHIKHKTSGSIVWGHFMNYPADQFVNSDGELFELSQDWTSLDLIGSFGVNLGRHIAAVDVDGDQVDEIIGCNRGIEAYSALDFSRIWHHEIDISVDALSVLDINNDGIDDILCGDDQWGNIYALDSKTGEEFWKIRNPEHGVTAITAADFDGDGSIEIAWGAGWSSTGADYFYIVDVETKEEEWKSTDLDGPFLGYNIIMNPNQVEFDILLSSSTSDSGYGGGITFSLEFDSKEVIWRTVTGEPFSGGNGLVVGDVDNDGSVDIINFGSNKVKVINYDDGSLKYTTQLDSDYSKTIKSCLVEDLDNDGQMKILVGDSKGGITILNGDDGSESDSYSQIGYGYEGVTQLATTKDGQNVVDTIFALTDDGLWKINRENRHVKKVGNSSFNPTSVATTFHEDWKLFVGDADGQLHTLGEGIEVEHSYQLCTGPITFLQPFQNSLLSFTCQDCFGLVDTTSDEILVRQAVETDVWRAQAYNINNQLYFLTGGELVTLWSQVG